MNLVVDVRGDGPGLVLIHGWGAAEGVWGKLLPLLIENYRVHILALPGYGVNAGVSCRSFAEVSDAVANAMPDNSICIGWSLGGMIGLNVGAVYPEKVSRLVMVGSNPCFVRKDDWEHGMPAAQFGQFSSGLLDDPGLTLKRFVALQFHGVGVDRLMVRDMQKAVAKQSFAVGVLEQGLSFLEDVDLREQYKNYSGDAFVVLGGKDRLVPVSLRDGLDRLNSSISSVVMADEGHAPFISDPEGFVEQVFA